MRLRPSSRAWVASRVVTYTMRIAVMVSPVELFDAWPLVEVDAPHNFKIGWPGANVNALFPIPQFKTLQDAQQNLIFSPLEPSPLPPGFQPRGVWVFAKAVLLRYTDGVATFSLYEHQVAATKNPNAYIVPPRMYERNVQRWRISVSTGDIEIDYIGHLPPAQAQAVHDSLR